MNRARLTDTESMWPSRRTVVGDGKTGSVGFGGGHGNPFQYSCLEHPMNKGAWQATVYRVEKSGD